MFAIIFSAFAMLICAIAIGTNLMVKQYGWALIMLLLFIFNSVCLCLNINSYQKKKPKEPKVERVEVSDVINYQIDSTEVIHGADTVKTYNITYWK